MRIPTGCRPITTPWCSPSPPLFAPLPRSDGARWVVPETTTRHLSIPFFSSRAWSPNMLSFSHGICRSVKFQPHQIFDTARLASQKLKKVALKVLKSKVDSDLKINAKNNNNRHYSIMGRVDRETNQVYETETVDGSNKSEYLV